MRKRLLIAVLVLLLAPVALVAVLLYTPAGVHLIAQQLPRLERFGVVIEGVSGTLAGPLHIERFELNHPRVHVVSRGIVIDAQMRGLLLQTLRTSSVTATDTLVEIREADLPPSERPPRFLPGFMRIDARGVNLKTVRYVHVNGTSVEADSVSGRVTVTSRRLRVRGFEVNAPQFDAAGKLRLLADKPLGVQGSVSGHLRLPRGELALDAQVDGTLDRLGIKARMQQPDQAAVDALFTRADGAWRLAGQVTSPSLDLNAFVDRPPFSLRNVALDVVATAQEVHAAGVLGIPEVSDSGLRIDARGRFADRILHVASADLSLNDLPARLHAAGTVAFDGEAPSLDLAAQWTSLQWPLTGEAIVASASGEATMRGPLPYDFTVNAQVSGHEIPAAQGEARGVVSREQLSIANYRITALEGVLSGAGSLQWATPRAWTLAVAATDVNPAALHAEFPGRVSFAARADGAGLDRNTNFSLELDRLEGTLRNERVRAAGAVQRDRKGWTARDVSVNFGDATLALDGSVRDDIDVRWTLQAPSLADLLPQAAGSIRSSGSASGPRRTPHIVATVQGEDLRYQGWSASRLAVDADVDASGKEHSSIRADGEGIGRDAPLLGQLHVRGEGVAGDHHISIDAAGIAPDARQSPPRALLEIAGAYDQELWNATILSARLMRAGGGEQRTVEIAGPARIEASTERAQVEDLCFVIGAGRICGEGKWRRGGAWDGMISGYEIPLAFVLPPSGAEAEYAGRIEGRIRANGAPGQPWQGDAGMRIIDAAIIYRPPGAEPQTLNLGTGGLAATATPARIDFSFGVQAFADTFLYANAQLQRDGAASVMNLPLSGDLRARAADANILPLVFPEIDHAAGLLTAEAKVAGTLAQPEINGRIELADGEFDSYRVNLALRDLDLVAQLASNGLDFRGSGRAGEGRFEMDGRFTWRGGASSGNLHLRGENLLVADLSDYRVVASPDLRFVIEGERMDVAGDVTIPSALIQPNELGGAVRVSDDARYVGEHPAEREGRFTVHSEVRVAMGEDVRVNAFGLQGLITGAVGTTVHTGETPVGRGQLGIADGRYVAYGQSLHISRGQLLFDASPLDDPGLDIEARRQVDATTVGLNVRGTLQQPRLTLFSDPSMPQSQIVAYLLMGASMDSGVAGDAASARETLTRQGGGLLASQLGQRIGLDAVGVESSVDAEGESNSSLVLGKFLSPRLFISYGISLTESINTLKLRYTISDRWVLRTEAGEQQSADVEFTIER